MREGGGKGWRVGCEGGRREELKEEPLLPT